MKDRYEDGNYRLDIIRNAAVYWRGEGKYTHLPTNMVERFEVSWNDRSQQKGAWEKLRARVAYATRPRHTVASAPAGSSE
jgi:hypothetical protein